MRSFRYAAAAGCVLAAAVLTGCGASSNNQPAAASSKSPAPSTPSAAAAPGVPFTSPEFHFAVTFPAEPEQTPISQSFGAVNVTGRVFSVGKDVDGVSVSVLAFPAGTPVNAGRVLDGAVRGAAAGGGGTVTSDKAESFQGRPARNATIAENGTTVSIEAIIDNNRLVALVGAPPAAFDQARNTFKLLP